MTIEQYDYGITREYIDDGQIAVITTQGDMRRAAIDTWADLSIDTMQTWKPERPILILQNLSHKDQGITPYSRKRAEDAFKQIPSQPLYSAIILPNSFINRVIGLFVGRQRMGQNQESRIFTNLEDGLAWLREKQKKSTS